MESVEKFVKDIAVAQAANEKIEVTSAQKSAIEALVVGYMMLAKNEAGIPEHLNNGLIFNLDKVWDNNFIVKS